MAATLDAPGTACAFQSNNCTASMLGHGGFQIHHEWPVSMGGPADSDELPLCPLHHVRQHSLIRYLVECDQAGTVADWDVLEHFTAVEREAAYFAVDNWANAGRPAIAGWPCPAARVP